MVTNRSLFRWEIEDDCLAVIKSQYEFAKKLADSVDMYILPFGLEHNAQGNHGSLVAGTSSKKGFGKRLIKTFKVSPDAYVQLALQLANYRDQVFIETKFRNFSKNISREISLKHTKPQ